MSGWRRAVAGGLVGTANVLARLARLLGHVAMGVMTPRGLEEAAARSWDEFSAIPFSTGAELLPWEERLYARILRPGDRVLVLGCGAGRDLVALALRGHAVDGIDIAPRALDAARRRVAALHLDSRLERASAADFEMGRTYDLVVFSWYCYAYLPGRAERARALHRAARHLAPGGRLVVTYPLAERRPSRALLLTRAVARLLRSGWEPEPGDSVVTLTGASVSLRYERPFTAGEVADEVATAGLRVAEQDVTSGVGVSVVVPA